MQHFLYDFDWFWCDFGMVKMKLLRLVTSLNLCHNTIYDEIHDMLSLFLHDAFKQRVLHVT